MGRTETNNITFPIRAKKEHKELIRSFAKDISDLGNWIDKLDLDLKNYDFNYKIEITDKRNNSFKLRAEEIKAKYNHKFNK